MNEQQLANWKRVSTGLAAKAFPAITPDRRRKLADAVEEFIEKVTGDHGLAAIGEWDGNAEFCCVADALSSWMWERRYERACRDGVTSEGFGDMVSACIRSGFDLAVSPSAGVVAFTLGDLRAVFDGELPQWVASQFEPALPDNANDAAHLWL